MTRPTCATCEVECKPFTVAFDGAVLTGSIAIRSVREIDRLMKVLQAQKAAFEAMQDDEEAIEIIAGGCMCPDRPCGSGCPRCAGLGPSP